MFSEFDFLCPGSVTKSLTSTNPPIVAGIFIEKFLGFMQDEMQKNYDFLK